MLRHLPLLLVLFALPASAAPLHIDSTKVVGPDECGECHKDEVAVWRETKHQKAFYELARTDEAKKIAKAMGIRRLKADSACVQCHFTMQHKDGADDAIAGVSCESCHGAAKEWYEVHNDYGGKDVKKARETPEHKAGRLAAIDAAGMIRPDDIYALAANCYQCHLVPNEELVNKGGHQAGSDEFELVTWSQGENRHNFYRSADGKHNEESSLERRRVLYLVGQALDLEYALRGVARATAKDTYGVTLAQRAARDAKRVAALHKLLNLPELAAMVDTIKGISLKLNNEAELTAAADAVQAEAKKLAQRDGSALAALDPYLPKPDAYKGTPGSAVAD